MIIVEETGVIYLISDIYLLAKNACLVNLNFFKNNNHLFVKNLF